ncbi:MAG: hypothetical protein JSR48_10640 [Verrucomicrobia bacterium]|nr:hypothetical protein [Verrucomicrobiota bacterium]
MSKPPWTAPAAITAIVLALAMSGCASGPAARAAERADVFQRLTTRQQANLRDGVIEGDYTADMVYIALGRPSTRVPAYDGEGELWTYRNFYPSRHWVGASLYRRTDVPERAAGGSLQAALGPVGDVRDPNRGGGYGDGISSAGSPAGDAAAATLRVWLRNGRVVRFELQP